ncbi:MAG: TolC family protein [Paracoccaceae bacterium]
MSLIRSPARAGLLLACGLLAGCFGGNEASRSAVEPGAVPSFAPQKEVSSPLIADLMARRSILPGSGPYADVATAVIRASSGAGQAELRVARLRAAAQAKNWVPKIGPDVSLTSLSSIAAGIVLDTAILDNGKRKAERAYAAADVEVAAITLASDMNQRVHDGLSYYLAAERARQQAAVSEKAEARLAEFERIMAARVEGGLSDGSERAVVAQKHLEMKATLAADRQAEATAMAELAAIAGGPLPGVRGLQPLPPDTDAPEPLSVMQTRAEGTRLVAQAESEKSGLLPSLGFDADIGKGGISPEINLGGLMRLGDRDVNKALKSAPELAARRTADAIEDANRDIVALRSQIATLDSQQAEGDGVLKQTAANYETFAAQYKAGRRTLLELVSQYDDYARLERDQVSLKYQAAALRLQIARDRGVLVDGGRM